MASQLKKRARLNKRNRSKDKMTKVIFSAKIQRVKTFRKVRFLSKIKTENVCHSCHSFDWKSAWVADWWSSFDWEERKKSDWCKLAKRLFSSTSEVLMRNPTKSLKSKMEYLVLIFVVVVFVQRNLKRTSSITLFSFPFSFYSYIDILFVSFSFSMEIKH